MEHNKQWMIVVLVVLAALLLAACRPGATTPTSEPPSSVEEIPGSDLKRVVLTEKAAKRLDIQTVGVREEQVVQNRTLVGEVVALTSTKAAALGGVGVRVPLDTNDLSMVDRNRPALVLPLNYDDEEDSDDEENGWMAELDEAPGLDDAEEGGNEDVALNYVVDGAKDSLVPGQRVFVEVSLSGNEMLRKIIPFSALIYDVDGGTWVYTKEPDALAFVRQSVTIDYIEDDLAVLAEGPPAGTEVVTVGGAELYGAETGVSK